jgi:hypothetical protein
VPWYSSTIVSAWLSACGSTSARASRGDWIRIPFSCRRRCGLSSSPTGGSVTPITGDALPGVHPDEERSEQAPRRLRVHQVGGDRREAPAGQQRPRVVAPELEVQGGDIDRVVPHRVEGLHDEAPLARQTLRPEERAPGVEQERQPPSDPRPPQVCRPTREPADAVLPGLLAHDCGLTTTVGGEEEERIGRIGDRRGGGEEDEEGTEEMDGAQGGLPLSFARGPDEDSSTPPLRFERQSDSTHRRTREQPTSPPAVLVPFAVRRKPCAAAQADQEPVRTRKTAGLVAAASRLPVRRGRPSVAVPER